MLVAKLTMPTRSRRRQETGSRERRRLRGDVSIYSLLSCVVGAGSWLRSEHAASDGGARGIGVVCTCTGTS
jgi:hypothetical protein